jgi:signal transduction histidine kinase
VHHEERRAVERALHDGVQQDLIALCVRLQLLRQLVEADPAAALVELAELHREAHAALDRVRTLANDVYPSVLDARGLPEALRAAGATVDGEAGGRYPREVEAAAYFFCRDALAGAADLTVSLREEDGALRVDAAGATATFPLG